VGLNREFWIVKDTRAVCIGQDMDGQGLKFGKALANHHGLPLQIREGYTVTRECLPDAEHADLTNWPKAHYAPLEVSA
jgi:hypothetical protein